MQFKINHKLFLVILVTNIIVAGSLYVAIMLTFDRSFKQYLDEAQAKKLEPMVTALAEMYKEKQDWLWIRSRDNRLWSQLIAEHVLPLTNQRSLGPPPQHQRPGDFNDPMIGDRTFPPPGPPPFETGQTDSDRSFRYAPPRRLPGRPPGPPPGMPPGHLAEPPGTLEIAPQILLADSNHEIVIGDPSVDAHWVPINVDNNTVGYLGFFRAVKLTSEIDTIFINKLQSLLGWILLVAVLFSVAFSVLLAKRIVKPINDLRSATKKLAAGDYSTRIDTYSNDEIGELSHDFNLLAEKLSHNLKARQQWIADISHELRTPVAVLQGELEALQDGVRVLTNDAVDSLHHEIVRLGRLINDLHQLSLSDLGSLSYKYEDLNLTSVIEDVIDHKETLIRQKQINLKFNPAHTNIIVNGDYHRLMQLFYNLLNNSLAYTSENGNISIDLSVVDNNVFIQWCDSEPGVNDEDLNNLFERLYRADTSRNRDTGGSGLGLSICKNIVEAHQGSIYASHAELGGLCFSIKLPLI